MGRFARLEIDGAVLGLDKDIVAEFAIQRLELVIGLFGAVGGILFAVDKGTPEHDAAMRRQSVGDHIGTFRLGAIVVAGAGLAFGIGLDHKAAEIGYAAIDGVRFFLPPS